MTDWQTILGQDGRAVWQTAYRILGNRADADECFQEACLGAVSVSRREPVQNWRALLQRMVTARAVDRLRERHRRRVREEDADWATVRGHLPSPAQGAEDAELGSRLREALAMVPPRQAEVFSLHCLDGWSYQEIATSLAISTDSVGVLLHRARQRLRDLMAGVLAVNPRPDTPQPKAAETWPTRSRKEPQ